MNRALDLLLARLEASKTKRPDRGETLRLLRSLEPRAFPDAESLIRFHEAVLFLRAYPHDRSTERRAERILSRFADRVEALVLVEGQLFQRPGLRSNGGPGWR